MTARVAEVEDCPECDTRLANVQGVDVCADCGRVAPFSGGS